MFDTIDYLTLLKDTTENVKIIKSHNKIIITLNDSLTTTYIICSDSDFIVTTSTNNDNDILYNDEYEINSDFYNKFKNAVEKTNYNNISSTKAIANIINNINKMLEADIYEDAKQMGITMW